jgi:phosphatidate cytidylyltransferase
MKTRILTAVILLMIAIPTIFIGGWLYAIFVALAISLSSMEICNTGHGNNNWPKRVKVLTVVFTLMMVFWNVANSYFTHPENGVNIGSTTLVIPSLGIAATLLSYFILVVLKSSINVEDVAYLFTMSMFLTLAGQSALFTRGLGIHSMLFVCIVSFMTDTGAYFIGVSFGKNKINPRISPKKTYEGAIGGAIIGTLSGIIYSLIFKVQFLNEIKISYYWVILIAFVLSIFAQIGDFTFSAIKRHYGVKDFSHLLPGHGGVLDRIDSIIVNLIVFSIIVINIIRGFSWWVG